MHIGAVVVDVSEREGVLRRSGRFWVRRENRSRWEKDILVDGAVREAIYRCWTNG